MARVDVQRHPHHAISREPHPALRPFVQKLWASEEIGPTTPDAREHVLPTGLMHLAVRLSPEPIALWEDGVRRELGHMVIGGARSTFLVKDVSAPSIAVGAQLLPGAATILFGLPADELAERHTRLDDVWGDDARRLRDRLAEATSSRTRVDVLETFLLGRLPRVRGVHPALADILENIADRPIASIVERSGMSHRVFIERFRGAVGLAPKLFARVLRFQRVARRLARGRAASIADVALDAGYADQAHLSREFSLIAGISPASYRALGLAEPNHVPVDASGKRPRRPG